jgi:hypothetical protein
MNHQQKQVCATCVDTQPDRLHAIKSLWLKGLVRLCNVCNVKSRQDSQNSSSLWTSCFLSKDSLKRLHRLIKLHSRLVERVCGCATYFGEVAQVAQGSDRAGLRRWRWS